MHKLTRMNEINLQFINVKIYSWPVFQICQFYQYQIISKPLVSFLCHNTRYFSKCIGLFVDCWTVIVYWYSNLKNIHVSQVKKIKLFFLHFLLFSGVYSSDLKISQGKTFYLFVDNNAVILIPILNLR